MPRGVSTLTLAPTLAFISALPIGDSAESRPSARLASVEPTRVQTLVLPLASSRTSALRPKAKESAALGVDLDHDRVVEPLLQALDPRLQVRLVLFGDVILGVLLEVALLAGDLDPRRHLLAGGPFELRQLGFEVLDPGRGDRLAGLLWCVHGLSLSETAPVRLPARGSVAAVFAQQRRRERLHLGAFGLARWERPKRSSVEASSE